MNPEKRFLDGFYRENFSQDEVRAALELTSSPRVDFYTLMLLATVISTFGLLLNNTAIIIGAMLIAPLMDPILGVAFSSLTRNDTVLIRATFTLLSGIILALLISSLLTLPFLNLGFSEEVLSRVRPTLMDLIVALATGFVAGYAKIRKNMGGIIFGVAVSISLIPPLCVVGIGIAHLDPEIYIGAALLFLSNLVSILFSGALAFLMLKIRYFEKSLKSILYSGIGIAILAIPLSFSLVSLQEKRLLENTLTQVLEEETYTFKAVDIVSIRTDVLREPLKVEVTVRGSAGVINDNQVRLVQAYLARKTGKPVQLTVNLSPVIQMKGFAEPSEGASSTMPGPGIGNAMPAED